MILRTYLPIILAVLVGLAVFIFRRGRGKIYDRSYQTALGLGVVWVAMGVIFESIGIGYLGAIMMLLGLILWLKNHYASTGP